MGKAFNPSTFLDQLGSVGKAWAKLYVGVIYDAGGNPALFFPLDASVIQTGVLDADRIDNLNLTTQVDKGQPDAVTLATIIANAALGAQNPVTRINTGPSAVLDGKALITDSVNPNVIRPDSFFGAFNVGVSGPVAGMIQTDNYNPGIAGWSMSKNGWEVVLATAIFRGILAGTININNGFFNVDANGNLQIGAPTTPAVQHGINNDGSEFWGADIYANANLQVDKNGNFFLADGPTALSSIDPGAVSTYIAPVIPSQSGGQHVSSITFSCPTRGARIYYTIDGSDPLSADGITLNLGAVLWDGVTPVAISSGSHTVRVRASKLGQWSTIGTFTFAASGTNACPNPQFLPTAGFYSTSTGHLSVTISTPGLAGTSIKYTTDGTTPSASNGIPYTGPVDISGPSVQLQAYATKATYADSNVTIGNYSVTRGGGDSGGGGGGHNYQR